MTGSTQIPTRPGPRGVVDRMQLLIVRAVFAKAMSRLPTAAAEHRKAA